MLSAIVAVVVSYLSMGLLLFVALTGAYLAMGADRAFQPGTYDVSGLWIAVMFAVGFAAAFIGGVICRGIAKSAGPVRALMFVVFILGAMQAVGVALTDPPEGEAAVRSGDVSNLDAMSTAQTPLWIAIANPIVGVAGIALGGLRPQRRS